MAETDEIEKVLNDVQRSSLDKNIFGAIVKVLDSGNNYKSQSIQTLLELCIHDPKDDVEYATEALTTASLLITKVTNGEFTTKVDLLPSMVEILRMIKTSIYSCTSDKIKVLYFKLLTSYPDEVYLKLEEGNEVLELFNLYVHQRIPIELRVQPINVLYKYLNILTPEKRLKFIEQGINTWLLKLVPIVMLFAKTPDFEIETPLATLEIIVDDFLLIDYYDNPNLQCILQCFYEPQKYPSVLKNLLARGSDIWHRLWIVFIKILKNQLTKSGSSGSPINSMLPVVETAFKLDVTNRCRAFVCWNALIDNFASETNEAYVNKRIKLLVIPLYSNNAKVEETVIAKVNTWWHLICSYCSKLSNFAEMILIPFLQFCFGKPIDSAKTVQAPGMLTVKTKECCVKAFLNIFGHFNCDGCVSVPVLKNKIITEKCLLASRKELVYGINASIKIVANNGSELRQPYKCAWMSFIKLIGDVTDEKLSRGLFNDLLEMLDNLIRNIHTDILADIVLNDLIFTLFKGDDKIMYLLNPTNMQNGPMQKVMLMILSPLFDRLYDRNDISKTVEDFKPFAEFMIKHCFDIAILDNILNQLSANYKSLVIWTAIASFICEKKCIANPKICKILHWPLKHLDLFTKVELSTSMWLTLINSVDIKLAMSSINDDILKAVANSEELNVEKSSFLLNVAIISLSQKITVDKGIECEKEVRLICDISNKMRGLDHTHPVFSKLIDTLLELFKRLLNNINVDIAKQVLRILKVVFTILMSEFKQASEINAVLLRKIEQLLKSLEDLLKLDAYTILKQIVLTEFLEYAQCFGQQQSLKATILATLESFLESFDNNDPSVNTLKNLITSIKEASNLEIPIDKTIFTTPVTRKGRKKESSIVNTVVEDGEEFVVVKSNWKFNPKTLTENQKEKLKRKREDIPALYQDLSQSQDDFKLSTWKTDSQDTTTNTTSSKSNDLTTSEKVSTILKNMPNTDVVPKILRNILTDAREKNYSNLESTKEHHNESPKPTIKVKPRLSLKDRVFRNVRILTEKCDDQNSDKHINSVTDDVASHLHTPTDMKIKTSNANSAPSDINIHRPSRIKRKPKKFEEMKIFSLKKTRNSLCNGESENRDSPEDMNNSQVTDHYENDNFSTKLVTSNAVSENQDQIIADKLDNVVAPDLVEDASKQNDEESKNVIILERDENMEKQQQSSESNVIAPVSSMNIENNAVADNSTAVLEDTSKNSNTRGIGETGEETSIQTISNKKAGKKKSRIEKELAIDMVEGHPFLKAPSEKRLTRKKASESPVISRRKSLTQKLNKSKTDNNNTPTVDKKSKDIVKVDKSVDVDTFSASQESNSQDDNGSQDIIESSQDSTVSIMSVKSTKPIKRIPVVALQNIDHKPLIAKNNHSDENTADNRTVNDSSLFNCKNNDDSDFSFNKTVIEEIDLTENFDTQPMEHISSNEIIVINDEDEPCIVNNLDGTYIDMDTQDIADADTQPMDSNSIINLELGTKTPDDKGKTLEADKLQKITIESVNDIDASTIKTPEETTKSLTESLLDVTVTTVDNSLAKLSPKDDEQRKRDFLNNTLEISPIKTLSPVRENKSPSPETSSDYVVIKLSSPVQSNGEPFEKCDSPEIFTEEKVSPDKRDQSPPREEIRGSTASPRSLSLKKNKPQVRSGGRAAQMLGLCIPGPDRLQTILNSESKSVESEEPKKSSPLNSTARRNLRILYNTTNETSENMDESEESDHFLKMKRSLPAADSSPAVPILKRKLADIVDETTVSPANKRKRVSFHDPPVSTTVCVKKYIEASSVRSPQNSAIKRQERQFRSPASGTLKSQKRLDTVFKLDTALTKAVESFNEGETTANASEDTEMSSLEQTPMVEVVKNSELNDVDPICMDLVNCKDPVDNIAGDLSSSAMRPLLVKEFAGKIETVGDLAKLTELEVNRLCIKAPKVQVVKKVLTEYAKKVNTIANEMTPMTEAAFSESTVLESTGLESKTLDLKAVDVEMQTDCIEIESVEIQTEVLVTSLAGTQTDPTSIVDCEVQTVESGSKTTADIAKSLLEKPDFCSQLKELLDVQSKQSIATSLPLNVLTDIVLKEIDVNSTSDIMDRLLDKHSSDSINGQNSQRSFMRDYLSKHFNSKDLILLCQDLLKRVYDNI